MSQVFRVGDLAQQMGVTVEELIFKLRSIGVEVTKAEDTLDLATVRAIITGETLHRRPREVIVRKEPSAVEDPSRKTQTAVDQVKRRRPARRVVGTEELPDHVPNLENLVVPASPRPPARAAEPLSEAPPVAIQPPEPGHPPDAKLPEPVDARTAAEIPPVQEDEVESPAQEPVAREAEPDQPVEAEEPGPEVELDAASPEVVEEPAAAVDRDTEPEPAADVPELVVAEPARVPVPEAAAGAPPKAAPAKAARKTAKTPLESQLRELSDEEVKQRLLAAKQAAVKAAEKPAAAVARGKSRKAKSAADANEIRDLLAKFEESKVRAKTDAAAPPPPPLAMPTRGRAPRPRRERGEAAVARTVTVSFRDGLKPEGPVYLSEAVTVRELAEKLNVLVKDLMAYLISKKILVTANQGLPQELAEQICEELGIEAMVISFEDEIDLQQEEEASGGAQQTRPPVVTVMGHVDHGKTSLLDVIRSTRVAAGEAGGITQHIGASRVLHKGKPIVFIDTPGHEAFTQMRARGAKITDLVVLVVAADDGVMPQTIEAINHARAAHVPIVVAINKIDKPNANPDRVKQALSGQGVLVEGWGGEVPAVNVSALKGTGIDDLLEVINLVSEMQDLKAGYEGMARGTVLEARKERGRGVVATVLIQQGQLRQGDCFFAGATYGRIRAMTDTTRRVLRQAEPSDAVEIMGFEEIPEAGDVFQVVENEARAREVANYRRGKQREEQMAASRKVSLEGLMDKIKADEVKALNLVLKADVQGSVEVLRDTLLKLATEEVGISVLHASVGAITDNDILLASASQAVVIGFNVRPERSAKDLAERERVDVRLYSIIYNLTEDIQKAMSGMLEPTYREEELGRAEVREIFTIPKVGTIAGCMVLEGVIQRSAKARLLRDNVVVWEGNLGSLRRFKEDASEVRHGYECGIGLERYQDIKQGDIIEVYRSVQVAREVS